MTQFIQLTKRNILLYFRDRSSVFFSMLSMIIIIVLMIVFLGDMHIDNIINLLEDLPNHNTSNDKENAEFLILIWTIAGIIPINAVTVNLSALAPIVKDKTTGKINSIYTSPASRFTITASYVTASCISSVIICLLTLIISEAYLSTKGIDLFTLQEHLQILLMILINSFTYSAIMYLFAVLVKSEGAWSAIGTIVGTVSGFLGGIYLPVGQLSDGLTNIVSCTPIIYGTAMFRNIMTQSIINKTFNDAPSEMISQYKDAMGINFETFGKNISPLAGIIIVVGFGILFTIAGVIATKFSNRKDR